jgi:phospholipid transport system substrate-binding protein
LGDGTRSAKTAPVRASAANGAEWKTVRRFVIESTEITREEPMRARRILSTAAMAVLLVLLAHARPAAAADPAAFMNNLGTRVLQIINDKATPEATRKEQFHQLADSAFDVPKIARFVLGRYWLSANGQQKSEFTSAFETYMLQVYWSRFQSYNGETFKVSGVRDEGNGTILVTTQILRSQSGEQPVSIDWDLAKSGDSFKIEDASLEGVSQALTYRDEFGSIIERNDGQLSALIDQLKQRAKG